MTTSLDARSTVGGRVGLQTSLVRYAAVGLGTNATLLVLYAALIWFGAHHVVASTLSFCVGMTVSFVFNRNWTFESRSAVGPAMRRYAAAYSVAYVMNIAIVVLAVDGLGANRMLAQAAAIVAVAVMLFAVQRIVVFGERRESTGKNRG